MATVIEERVSAGHSVASYMASCLPHGVPPCHRLIANARFVGFGRRRVAVADVEMFDGQPATIEVFRWGPMNAFGHRWTAMQGGAAFYEDGRWQRDLPADDSAAEEARIEALPAANYACPL